MAVIKNWHAGDYQEFLRRQAVATPMDAGMVRASVDYTPPARPERRLMVLAQKRKDWLLDQLEGLPAGDPRSPDLRREIAQVKDLIARIRDDRLGADVYDLLKRFDNGRPGRPQD